MHVVLDLQACQSPESSSRGIGRYSLSLAKAIAANPRGHRITVLLNGALSQSIEPLRGQFDGLLAQDEVVVWDGLKRTALIDPGSSLRRRASELLRLNALRRLNPDVVHVASVFEGVADDVVSTIPVGEPYVAVATLYDLIPLVHQDIYLADPSIRVWYMHKIEQLLGARQLLGISRFSCNEARQLLSVEPDRVTDISGAADVMFARLNASSFKASIMARYGIRKPFIMYAGGFDSRKNIAALIRAFAMLPTALRRDHQLVIVGRAPGPEKEQLENAAKLAGLDPEDVLFADFVPDADLVKLYNLCEIYAFPSLQEGFGLPALEAMSSGAVVIGSRTSSLPEVIGLDEALFDPSDDADISARLAAGLTDAAFRDRFRAHAIDHVRKFSWTESAQRALQVMERAFGRDEVPRPAARPRPNAPLRGLAFLPVPGSVSGSAMRLAGAEVFREESDELGSMRTLAEFEGRRDQFERVVVEIADDPYCANTLDLTLSLPTDVVVSSPRIGKVWYALASRNRRALVEAVYRYGGYPLLRAALDARFEASVMAEILPPAALGLFARNQVVSSVEPSHETGSLHGAWRDRTDTFLAELFEGGQDADRKADIDWVRVASSLSRNALPPGRPKHWFVDISNLAIRDAGTGIQRVVRHLLDELMANPPKGCRVEPVTLGEDGIVRHARSYCTSRYFPGETLPGDEAVECAPGDVYLGLDLVAHLIPAHIATFKELRDRGVLQYFVVYDLLPLLRPDCFEPHLLPLFRSWYEAIAQVADGVLCISRAVADEFESWLHQARPARHRALTIGWFHLGADLAVRPTSAAEVRMGARQGSACLPALEPGPTFLMVGTVEPRKGHAQALTAFEMLWSSGVEANLLVLGRPGWLVGELIERLLKHPMRGIRLFWLDDASDELLLEAYRQSSALLMPSEGEGYGLPLIEAARHGLPLIVRDLPVFREVAGEFAHYFSGYEAADIADSIAAWMKLHAQGSVLPPIGIEWTSWKQSADQLVEVLTDQVWRHRWVQSDRRRFAASDYRLQTQVGRLARGRIEATGDAGMLLYGPYIELPPGRYAVEVHVEGTGRGRLDVCSRRGAEIHGEAAFGVGTSGDPPGTPIRACFTLAAQTTDLEVRVAIAEDADLSLTSIELWPLESERESLPTTE